MLNRVRVIALVATVGLAACAADANTDDQFAGPLDPHDVEYDQPNVVLIYSDDQRVDDMAFMPKTRALLGDEGVTFTNSFVSLSLCCPARVAIVTGQHATNNGVWANSGPIGGYPNHDARRALPTWLDDAGYTNVHIGKTMHGTGDTIPPGWHDWQKPRGSDSKMFNWVLADNGTSVPYGEADADYQTDVYASLAVEAIEENAERPFFMKISTSAPHVGGRGQPPTPAPRHDGTLQDALPEPPSFNVAADGTEFNQADIGALRRLYRARAESLLSVDDLVETVIESLDDHGLLDNTIVMFTSDNGYMLGEHGLSGKVTYYEESIAVPLLIRGPGFRPGTTSTVPVQNIDYAVTIADVADATPTVTVDGRSIVDLMDDNRQHRALFIMSSRSDVASTEWWTGIRTRRFTYVRDADGTERLFDIETDPHQLNDLGDADRYASMRAVLASELDEFERCSGDSCDRDIDDGDLIDLITAAVSVDDESAVDARDSTSPEASGPLSATSPGLGTAPTVSATSLGNDIDVEWEMIPDATRYRVRIREVGGQWSQPEQVSTLDYVYSDLAENTDFQIQVSSRVDGRWGGDWTSVKIATSDAA